MKIIYTNISPITNAYTNINHIFYLKKQKPQKVYLCVWDDFVFKHPIFENKFNNFSDKKRELKENVKILEKLMTFLKINYKIIYLSEAMDRFFKNSNNLSIFQNILSTLKIEEFKKGYGLEYIQFGKITLSDINYIITDYLISLTLPELFPELCSSTPNYYLTSPRFKMFKNRINDVLKKKSHRRDMPKVLFVLDVPIIINPRNDLIPCIGMSIKEIKNILSSYYLSVPLEKEFYSLIEVLSQVLNGFIFNGKKIKKEEAKKVIYDIEYKDYIEFISINFHRYFDKIIEINSKIDVQKQKKSLLISNPNDFDKYLKHLNNIKFEILKNCNGQNTSLDISRKTGQKLSTVSTYMSHMRERKLLDNSKKPKRLIDSFIVDLEII